MKHAEWNPVLTVVARNDFGRYGFIFAVLVGLACGAQTAEKSCNFPERLRDAEDRLTADPLGAIELLESVTGCDEKFALLYSADAAIASRAEEDYYYQDKVYPRGWYDRDPSPFTRHVLQHLDRFRSAGETAGIRPASHWLDRIQNRRHPVIGAVELEELRSFDRAVWEDGDGSMHSDRLVRDYRGWLERWKNHDAAPEVERRIAELLN